MERVMRRFNPVRSVILSTVLLLVVGSIPANAEDSRADLLKRSSIIFVGTVVRLGATSFMEVPSSSRTLIARVDAVIEKPAAISLKTGDNVTVEVRDPSPFRQGTQATFYTTGWILGEGIAVQEIGHEISEVKSSEMAVGKKQREVAQIRAGLGDVELRASVNAADLVFVGKVKAVRKALALSAAPLVSEHDPDWHEAILQVVSPIKGGRTNESVVVRFPASLDVAWYGIPKFRDGQEGTFILKRDKISGAPKAMLEGIQVDTFTALSPHDVLPKKEEQRIRRLSGS
jgi:hypothetical protein